MASPSATGPPLPHSTAGVPSRSRKRPSRALPSKEFSFISSDSAGKPDPNVRKFIRSYVMRGKNKKRQDGTAAPQPKEPSPKPTRDAPSTTIMTRGPHGRPSADTYIQSPCLPGPFKLPSDLRLFNYAAPLDELSIELIFRYLTTIKETMYPAEWCFYFDALKVCWFRWLLEDHAYLESVLFLVSAFQDLLELQAAGAGTDLDWFAGFTPRTEKRLRKTIKNLQAKLEESDGQIDDITTSVVVTLAMVADAAGDTNAFTAHVKGLKQIVGMRGGLRGFEHNRQLQIKLCRVDLGSSIKNGTKPDMYHDKVSWEPFIEPIFRQNSIPYERTSSSALQSLIQHLDFRLKNIFTDLRDFSKAAGTLMSGKKKLPPEMFQEIMISIQYRLLSLEYPAELHPLQEAIRLGLLAYESTLFLNVRGIKLKSEPMSRQLREAIQRIPVDSAIIANLKLWLLIVGSIIVFDSQEAWLVEAIQELAGPQTWAEVRERVADIMWIDVAHDELGKRAFEISQQSRLV